MDLQPDRVGRLCRRLCATKLIRLRSVTSQARAEEAMALLAVEREETVRRELSIADAEARRIEAEEQRRRQGATFPLMRCGGR
mgnify:FL=1